MASASKKPAKAAKKASSKKSASKSARPAPKSAPKPAPVAFTEVPAPAASVPYPQSPVLDLPIAIVVLAVNLFVPGIGTIIAGVVGKHKMIGRGVAQFFLSIIIVGWVWGLITGIQCLVNANTTKPSA